MGRANGTYGSNIYISSIQDYYIEVKLGRKRPLDTPKRMKERREGERKRKVEGERERER